MIFADDGNVGRRIIGTGDPGGSGDPGGGGGGHGASSPNWGDGHGASSPKWGDGHGASSPKWVASLSSDFGGAAILSQIPDSKEMVSVPTTLVKNYVEGQRAIGGMTSVPKDGDAPEKFEKFYQSIGRPEKPEGYELKVADGTPEGFYDTKELSEFQAKAHSLGIPKKAAEELFAWRAEKDLAVYNEFTGGAQKTYEENIKTLKGEWGTNFDGNAKTANKAAIWAGGKDLADLLQKAGLIGNPVVAKAFHKIGAAMGEDTLKDVDPGSVSARKTYTEAQLKEMTSDPRYKTSEEFRKEVTTGWEMLYSGKGGSGLNPSRPRTR